ncbi:hypothetical protein CYMTET_48268 [Cymbomonas tetramitiformis]|uniref:GRF-type domain-containing protein n=1 Tax=Cymbomonas tetramitiformis TaxID=36881 RepID=A0AAE0BSM1_9CHLO|nr:hypothetical protein CYMTET_48268 [Cymbomonas tetramitiformis]
MPYIPAEEPPALDVEDDDGDFGQYDYPPEDYPPDDVEPQGSRYTTTQSYTSGGVGRAQSVTHVSATEYGDSREVGTKATRGHLQEQEYQSKRYRGDHSDDESCVQDNGVPRHEFQRDDTIDNVFTAAFRTGPLPGQGGTPHGGAGQAWRGPSEKPADTWRGEPGAPNSQDAGAPPPDLQCKCGGGLCKVLTAKTDRNMGRMFYKCPSDNSCGFFQWTDEAPRSQPPGNFGGPPQQYPQDGPQMDCPCGAGPCKVLTAKTERNNGRQFFKCPAGRAEEGGCNYFQWTDEAPQGGAASGGSQGGSYGGQHGGSGGYGGASASFGGGGAMGGGSGYQGGGGGGSVVASEGEAAAQAVTLREVADTLVEVTEEQRAGPVSSAGKKDIGRAIAQAAATVVAMAEVEEAMAEVEVMVGVVEVMVAAVEVMAGSAVAALEEGMENVLSASRLAIGHETVPMHEAI